MSREETRPTTEVPPAEAVKDIRRICDGVWAMLRSAVVGGSSVSRRDIKHERERVKDLLYQHADGLIGLAEAHHASALTTHISKPCVECERLRKALEGQPVSGDGVSITMGANFYTKEPTVDGMPVVGVGVIGMEEAEDCHRPIVTVRSEDGNEFEAFDNELVCTRESALTQSAGEGGKTS